MQKNLPVTDAQKRLPSFWRVDSCAVNALIFSAGQTFIFTAANALVAGWRPRPLSRYLAGPWAGVGSAVNLICRRALYRSGSPQAVSAASVQERSDTSTGLSMVADRMRPVARETLMSTSKVSWPTLAMYLPSEVFSTWTQLFCEEPTGAAIQRAGSLICGCSGGTWRTTRVAVCAAGSIDCSTIAKSMESWPRTTLVPSAPGSSARRN